MATEQQSGTQSWHLALAWAFVGIPLTLGVIKTLLNSMTLFH
ncbi:MAG: MFS transporter small subunit [Xanthobacteraceae bacterium]